MKVALNEHGQRRVAKAYCKLIAPLRAVARQHGYALTVHGSIKRDIDLVGLGLAEIHRSSTLENRQSHCSGAMPSPAWHRPGQ